MYWFRRLKFGEVVLRRFTGYKGPEIYDDFVRNEKIPRADLSKMRFLLTNTDTPQGSVAWSKIKGSNWCPHCVVDADGTITQLVPWNHANGAGENWDVAFVNLGMFEKYEDDVYRSTFGGVPWEPDQHGPMLPSKFCPLTKEQLVAAMYMMAAVRWECGNVDITHECDPVFGAIVKQFERT